MGALSGHGTTEAIGAARGRPFWSVQSGAEVRAGFHHAALSHRKFGTEPPRLYRLLWIDDLRRRLAASNRGPGVAGGRHVGGAVGLGISVYLSGRTSDVAQVCELRVPRS